jgi:hypothetical protein
MNRTDPTHTPDNLADPQGYQRHLVGLVGPEDPAEVQGATIAAWRALLAESGPDLRTRPEPAEWSVIECLGHAVDAELVMSTRYRWALAEDGAAIVGYDQDRWVAALGHAHADPGALLRLFEALRSSNLALWSAATPDLRGRTVRHQERGPESLSLMFAMTAGHDRFHLAQARRALAAVRAH